MENTEMLISNMQSLIEQLKQLMGGEANAPEQDGMAQESAVPEQKPMIPTTKAEESAAQGEPDEDDKKKEEAKKSKTKKTLVSTPDNGATQSDDAEKIVDEDSATSGTKLAEDVMKALGLVVKQMQTMSGELKAQKSLNSDILEALGVTKSLLDGPAKAEPVKKGYTSSENTMALEAIQKLANALNGQPATANVTKSRGVVTQELSEKFATTFMGIQDAERK